MFLSNHTISRALNPRFALLCRRLLYRLQLGAGASDGPTAGNCGKCLGFMEFRVYRGLGFMRLRLRVYYQDWGLALEP